MAETNGTPVTRDALRADLAEMKDELKTLFRDELKEKADVGEVARLATSVQHVVDWRMKAESGEFTAAQLMALDQRLAARDRSREDGTWSRRERRFAFASVVTAVVGACSGAIVMIVNLLHFKAHSR